MSKAESIKPAKTAEMKIIARAENDFTEKFGIPRQSGLANDIVTKIIFETQYRNADAFRGIEGFSHLWILWLFSETALDSKRFPTVRPPRLGGNKRMGVFATRSPYRPSPIGLSSVKIEKTELYSPDGPVIYVKGADIMNGTPILDIKPYLAYTDSHPDAAGGFSLSSSEGILTVEFPEELMKQIPYEKLKGIISVLSQDPRPQYQNDPKRIYTMSFGGFDISFTVEKYILTVRNVIKVQ